MKKQSVKQKISGLLAVLILILADRLTKVLAVTYLKDHDAIVLIPGVFELRYLENTGMAFGLLQGKMWIFYIVTAVIVLICLFYYFRIPAGRHFLPLQYTLVLLISGAFGNLIDRLMQQYVVDFLYFSLIDFPIFNVADIYVTCAAVLLFVLILFFYSDEDLKEISS